MSNPLITPNMFLTEPGIGTTLSPTWAQDLNNDIGILDQHNHSPGSGVQITPAGININIDLSFNGNNATEVNSLVYNGAVSGTPGLLSTFTDGTDLFYKDIHGNLIQLTKSGGPNVSPGNIQNLPSTPIGGAGISWINGQGTFQFLTDAGVAGANLDGGSVVIRYPGSYPTPSGNYIALQAPSTLATGFALTFPGTLPGSTLPLQLDIAGNISAAQITGVQIVTDVTLAGDVTVGNSLYVTSGGPQLTNNSGVLDISDPVSVTGTITSNSGVFSNGLSNAELSASTPNTVNVIDPGTSSNHPIVVSANPSTSGLMIVRGQVASDGSIQSGEGFTVMHSGAGIYEITFDTAFADAPAVTITGVGADTPNSFVAVHLNGQPASTGFQLFTYYDQETVNSRMDEAFDFIAIGQRNG